MVGRGSGCVKEGCANGLVLCVDDDECAIACGCGGREVANQLAKGFCFDHFQQPARMIECCVLESKVNIASGIV